MSIDNMIETVIGTALIIAGAALLLIFLAVLIWCGMRSIFGKTLNLPPSRRRWARLRAEVIRDDESDDINVRYNYDHREYTAKIGGFTVYGDKAIIYVKRKDPSAAKEFIPVPPMSRPVYISCLFIAAFILLMGAALLFAVLEYYHEKM